LVAAIQRARRCVDLAVWRPQQDLAQAEVEGYPLRVCGGVKPAVWEQRHDRQAAGTRVREAREQLGIDKHGYGPPEQRLADVDGLIAEPDRKRAHGRSHGWER
jgi:hypothetical protein